MLVSVLLLPLLSATPAPPLPEREFRAAWVATVDNIDWPSKPGLTTEEQRAELDQIVADAAALNLNAIIFQIRPHGDALYPSKLEPWSYYLTGQQGRAPEPLWDPLQHIIERAHQEGIQIHAWFNPYRANHPKQVGPPSADHVINTMPDAVYRYGTFQWMDPSVKRVQDHSFAVFMDVVERYNVDGIHIDDYFYPYPVRENGKDVPFPDEAVYQAYRQSGGRLGKSDWRRQSVNQFVKRVHDGIKERKPWVQFGISPFGIYRPGVPAGTTAGIDQFEALAADAKKWLELGWCDYMAPQLYWSIESKGQPFGKLMEWWASVNKKNRGLYPGLFTSRLDPANTSFSTSQITRQIELTRGSQPEVEGHIHFSMKALQRNWLGVRDVLAEKTYPTVAVPPAMPWLSTRKPAAPRVELATEAQGVSFDIDAGESPWVSVQALSADDTWTTIDLVGAKQRFVFQGSGVKALAFRSLDRFGNLSDATLMNL